MKLLKFIMLLPVANTPKAFTSFRLSGVFSPLFICTIIYLPLACPGMIMNNYNLYQVLLKTWYDNVLAIIARSCKMAKEVAARKHLAARSWKLVRNTDVNISGSIPTAVTSVEKLNSFNCDFFAVVDGQPGFSFIFCLAQIRIFRWRIRAHCSSINALGCLISMTSGWGQSGCHRLHFRCQCIKPFFLP